MKNNLLVMLLFPAFAFCQPVQRQSSSAGKSFSAKSKRIIVYTTADSTSYRITPTDTLQFSDIGPLAETKFYVFIDPAKTFQTMLGIGGALTDAAAETFAKLPKDKQEEVLKAYYDPKNGIGYTLARTNINSCDFSSGSYTYVEDNDKALKTFSVQHDEQYKIPLIKQAIAAAGGRLTLFASPWSPPAWMKDNNDILHGGKLKPEFYQPWANYYTKFIKAYQKEGIPIWGLTIQNEPMAKQTWESCNYTAEEERDFLKNYLGPTMKREGLSDKKIIFWDHNKDFVFERATVMLTDPEAAKYAWGVGYHWYEDWTGGDQVFDNIKRVHETFPPKNILFTEGCNGPFNMGQINDWNWGERYGRTMINDFNNGTVGWTDWNVLLDETGGPNHVQNFCFAPIHADTKTGKLIYMNAYYYIGQFSKFIKPGAKRITSAPSRSQLLSTAYVNPDGKIAVVVMNPTDKKITYYLSVGNKGSEVNSLPHSIATLVF